MSEMANLLGTPAVFSFDGKDYAIKPRDLDVEAAMEALLEERELKLVQRYAGRGLLSAEEEKLNYDGWRRSCTSGVWSFGSPDFVRYYCTPAGARDAVYFQLARFNKGVSRPLIQRMYDSDADWAVLMELIGRANARPTSPAGVEPVAGEATSQADAPAA